MSLYEDKVFKELSNWQKKMKKKPSLTNGLTKNIQKKINGIIPEKINIMITKSIKIMVRTVIFGFKYISKENLDNSKLDLEARENLIRRKIEIYKKTAMLSGAGTGAGGLILGVADFPIFLSLKIKFLFDAAGIYGFDLKAYKERLYILYVFQIAFSSDKRRNKVYEIISDWDNYSESLPLNGDNFDWRTFQEEYRDYIDIAKMLQLVPGIGAPVGAYANYKLMGKLGYTAMNAYRLRILK
ncbi:EcsC family protein [Clostridium tyrobutyricum]|uniref:EcsC family protein n=1 Tax=Clostridium tyrobutyricum TaxID=1519 RepID=UPI001C392F93|nr:EcsC family protein [Clostridium tyrobutyricum]MBV4424253.1 EcsC family protein [Clostridium tyrobutyricum]